MPNTLAHLGINGLVTRYVIKQADLLLIYIGAIIPDIPWIFQRIAPSLYPALNLYDLRLYNVIQASFFFCVIFSTALAQFFIDTKRTFIIFSTGSLMHLLLDSFETKWANGVQLFAPFSWELFNAGFFWPENVFVYALTAFGIFYLIFQWKHALFGSLNFSFKNLRKLVLAFSCFIIYLLLPLLFINYAEEADNHFVKTLRNDKQRIGKYFEIDRGNYVDDSKGDRFITPFNEELKIKNVNLTSSEIMSIRAKFNSRDEIQILDYHIHSNRDIFSYIGLGLVLLLFILSMLNTKKYKKRFRRIGYF